MRITKLDAAEKTSLKSGVGNFFVRGPLYKFFRPSDNSFQKIRAEIFNIHELQLACVERATPRAGQKALESWIWPVGRTLPTPVLSGS
jgi:hypothetical protein